MAAEKGDERDEDCETHERIVACRGGDESSNTAGAVDVINISRQTIAGR